MWDIADDVASKVSPQEFVKAWKFATSKPHTPLICDYDTQDDNRRFRMGLDKLIVLSNDEPEVEKIEKAYKDKQA